MKVSSRRNIVIFLIIIALLSLPLKLYTIDFSLPQIVDNLLFILRGISISQGTYAESPFKTNGYPLLLSPFFLLFDPNDYLGYVNITRILNIVISSVIIFPIYFLSRKFFDEKFSYLTAIFFAFQPQFNYVTGLGMSEPLFILVLVLAFYFFLNKNSTVSIYFSFLLVGLLWWTKMQGIIFIIPFLICHFILYRNTRNFVVCILIFLIVVSPILILRYNQYENPVFFSGFHGASKERYLPSQEEYKDFFPISSKNLLNAWGTLSVPYLIFLFPLGMLFSLRIKNNRKNFLSNWIILVLTLAPMLVQYFTWPSARPLYHIYPFLMIFSVLAVQTIIENNFKPFTAKQKKILIILLLCFVVISSVLVTHGVDRFGYGKQDPIEINEIRDYSKFLINNLDGKLFWSKGVSFEWLNVVLVEESDGVFKTYKINPSSDIEVYKFGYFKEINPGNLSLADFISGNSVEEIISKGEKLGLKYISVGERNDRHFFNQVYSNEEEFEYLNKIFDSNEKGFQKYKVKAFEIDYKKFHELKQ